MQIRATDGRRWEVQIPKDAPDGHVIALDSGSGLYRGELLHADRRPWSGVAVHAVPWGKGSSSEDADVSRITDESGHFELAGLGDREYRIRFQTDVDRPVWYSSGR